MFVYQGKLTWGKLAKDETFVVVLPNGPVRQGDSAYLFSQWTEDSNGTKKFNWFHNISVGKVTKKEGNDVFTLKGAVYTFDITTQKAYGSLSVTMSVPNGHKETVTVQRIWQSEDRQPTETARIWVGKISWLTFADNEPAIFIVPDGIGEGKPVLSLWQWTKDSDNKTNSPSFRHAAQKMIPGAGKGLVRFSYHSYYDITCTLNEETGKLAVSMKEGEKTAKIGEMVPAVILDRHKHSISPPDIAHGKEEFETRTPQPQPTLPRLRQAMPFPRGLFETLTHTASFLDQAGYLAKEAETRFAKLDKDLHAETHKVQGLEAEKASLQAEMSKLKGELKGAKAGADDIKKRLEQAQAAAKAEESKLNDEIKTLKDAIAADGKKDEALAKAFDETRKKLEAEQALVADLKAKLENHLAQISDLKAQLAAAKAAEADVQGQLREALLQLELQKKLYSELKSDHSQLETKHAQTESTLNATQQDLKAKAALLEQALADVTRLQAELSGKSEKLKEAEGQLEIMTEQFKEAKNDVDGRDDEITKLNGEHRTMKSDRDRLQRLLIRAKIPFKNGEDVV